jgi:hypothetical protein
VAALSNPAIAFFARRDLLGAGVDSVGALWELPEVRRVLGKQTQDGSWRYQGGKRSIRSRENYDQLETFRQLGILVEKFGFTRGGRPAMIHTLVGFMVWLFASGQSASKRTSRLGSRITSAPGA